MLHNPFLTPCLQASLDSAFSMPLFSGKEVKEIIRIGEDCEKEQASLYYKHVGGRFSFLVRRSLVAWVSCDKAAFVYSKVWEALSSLNRKHWGFEIDSLQTAQYTVYGPLSHYFYHMDLGSGGDVGKRKLSVSVNLSDPSEFIGGKLMAWRSADGKYPSQALGSIVAFPAYLIHRVHPVWWGTRRSLVFWATGRPFT